MSDNFEKKTIYELSVRKNDGKWDDFAITAHDMSIDRKPKLLVAHGGRDRMYIYYDEPWQRREAFYCIFQSFINAIDRNMDKVRKGLDKLRYMEEKSREFFNYLELKEETHDEETDEDKAED